MVFEHDLVLTQLSVRLKPVTVQCVHACVSGSISVADDLDFEVCKDYYLTVEAWDNGNPPLSTATMVTIELMDVNDNAPAFSQDIYNVLVSEDASVGQTITRVTYGPL